MFLRRKYLLKLETAIKSQANLITHILIEKPNIIRGSDTLRYCTKNTEASTPNAKYKYFLFIIILSSILIKVALY